jgi:tRNA threonylcarbamoyl adenosine modification protein YeaZ
MTARDGARRPRLLAIDTATSRVAIAIAGAAGDRVTPPLAEASWEAGQRHGETLLPALDRLLGEQHIRRSDLSAVVVGTGPGTFTGLRVGLATAKGLAHGLGIPVVGVSTAAALLAGDNPADDGPADDGEDPADHGDGAQAAGSDGTDGRAGGRARPRAALLLPAGPQDRVLVQDGVARLLPAGSEPDLPAGTTLVAVDLDGRAPPDAVARGERALAGLGPALLRLGAARLNAGGGDDLARLVPDYVTLPRGVRHEAGEVTWSRDPR